MARYKNMTDWEQVDWSQPVRSIMERTGACMQTVYRNRLKYGGVSFYELPRHDWLSVDWEKSNSEIARLVGTDRRYVSRQRARFSTPVPERSLKHDPANIRQRSAWSIARHHSEKCRFDGKRLREMRQNRALSQQALSDLIGCPKLDLIRQWEKNERIPSGDYMLRILIVLGVSPVDLIMAQANK